MSAEAVAGALAAGATLVRAGLDVIERRKTEEQAALAAMGAALELLPVETLKQWLEEPDRLRARLAADVAASLAFGFPNPRT